MKEILLIGGGGHCRSVIDVIEQECRFEIVSIFFWSRIAQHVPNPKMPNVFTASAITSELRIEAQTDL